MRALLLPVDGALLAVPLLATREVVTAPTVTPLATAPAFVLGLFTVRGEIIPLFDAAQLLGLGGWTPARYAAVLDCPGGAAGLALTAAPSILQVDPEQLAPSPLAGASGTVPVTGPGRVEDLVATLLDLDALFGPGDLRLEPATAAGAGP